MTTMSVMTSYRSDHRQDTDHGLADDALLRLVTQSFEHAKLVSFGAGSRTLASAFSERPSNRLFTQPIPAEPGTTAAQINTDADNDIDLALLPPPREWPAGRRQSTQWLTSVANRLSPRGEVLFVAPNRFGTVQLRHWLRGRRPERSLTVGQYGRRLRAAGLRHIELYGVTRDQSGLVLSVRPLWPAPSDWAVAVPETWKQRIKYRFNLTSEILVRASSAPLTPPIVVRALRAAAMREAAEGSTLRIEQLFTTAKGKAFLVAASRDRRWIVRIPLTDHAMTATRRYSENLDYIRKTCGSLPWLPRICGNGDVDGIDFVVETAINGRALPSVLRDNRHLAYLPQLIENLRQLVPQTDPSQQQRLDGDTYDRLVATPLDHVLQWVDDGTLRDRVARYFDIQLRGTLFLPAIVHGDFGVRNIFVSNDCVSGVIDWDDARRESIGPLDGINLLISVELYRSARQDYAATLFRLAYQDWSIAEERTFLDTLYQVMHMDPSHHPGLVYLYWLHATDTRLQDTDNLTDDIVDRYILQVVRTLEHAGKL